MKTSKRLKSQVCIALLGAGCLIGSTAYADATDSTTLSLSVTVAEEYEVDIGQEIGSEPFIPSELINTEGAILGTAEVCLASNQLNNQLSVTISQQAANGYALTGGAQGNSSVLPYKVSFADGSDITWVDDVGTVNSTDMGHGDPQIFNANSSNFCELNTSDYSSFIEVVSDYNGVDPLLIDTYTGTLNITVGAPT